MSLIGWWKLNNSNDNGVVIGNPGTRHGGFTATPGKITPNSDFFNGTDTYIDIEGLGMCTNYSISFWFKKDAIQTPNPQYFIDGRNAGDWWLMCNYNGYAINFLDRLVINYGDVKDDIWHHVCITMNSVSGGRIYIDGELKNTSDSRSVNMKSIRIGARYTNVNFFNGAINDVKIYDHTLSTREVQELSRAKMLHYKCNQLIEPTENLVRINNQYETSVKSESTGYQFWYDSIAVSDLGIVDGDSLTVSADLKVSPTRANNGGEVRLFVWTRSDGDTWVTSRSVGTASTEWERLSVTLDKDSVAEISEASDGKEAIEFRFGAYHYPSSNDYGESYIRKVQIEFKDHATPYTPTKRNGNLTNDAGYREYDGNLSIGKTPTWVKEGAMGVGSYKFNGGNEITTNQMFYDNINQSWTVSAWVKAYDLDKGSQYLNNFNLGNRIIHGGSRGPLLYINNGDNDAYTYSDGDIPENQWVHLTFVLDTNIQRCQIFKNGEEWGTASSAHYEPTDTPHGFDTTTVFGTYFEGLLDDIRIYGEALSPNEIKDIYQERANVDRTGNLHAHQLIESLNYNEAINCQNLVENGDGEYGNNFNFTQMSYDPAEKCFYYTSTSATIRSDNFIEIKPDETYTLEAEFEYSGSEQPRMYFGLYPCDKDFNFIYHQYSHHYTNTETTLAQDLNPGDSYAYLTSDANWQSVSPGSARYNKRIGVWPDSWGYPAYTYTNREVHYTDVGSNKLTLKEPWPYEAIPAGAPAANMYSGGSYEYIGASNASVPTEWTKFSVSFKGNTLRPGTKYVKILFLLNRDTTVDVTTRIRNIRLYSNGQNPEIKNKDISIPTKQGQVISNGFSEVGPTNGLVSWWSFDKGARDISGQGNHGSITGATHIADFNNMAYKFDGIDDVITADMPIASDSDFTFSAWVNREESVNDFNMIMGSTLPYLAFEPSGKALLSVRQHGQQHITIGNTVMEDGKWYHIIASLSSTQGVKIYINGELDRHANIVTGVPNHYSNIGIGARTSKIYHFKGMIGDVRIYNRALTDEEVRILHDVTNPFSKHGVLKDSKGKIHTKGQIKEAL